MDGHVQLGRRLFTQSGSTRNRCLESQARLHLAAGSRYVAQSLEDCAQHCGRVCAAGRVGATPSPGRCSRGGGGDGAHWGVPPGAGAGLVRGWDDGGSGQPGAAASVCRRAGGAHQDRCQRQRGVGALRRAA